MFTIGTGVGGGTVLGGRVYRGATGAAPETGHTIIGLDLADGAPQDPGDHPQPGSLEALASGRALDRLALAAAQADADSFLGQRLSRDGEVTGHDAVDGAKEGDEASPALPAHPRRAARDRDRQRHQPLRPAGDRDRRRRVDRRRPPARARREAAAFKYVLPGRRHEDADPARAPRPARGRARARR